MPARPQSSIRRFIEPASRRRSGTSTVRWRSPRVPGWERYPSLTRARRRRTEIVAIEQEIRVELPGIDLPLLAYPDVVFATPAGDVVLDHKVSAARPQRDELHDRLDLQLLAFVHGWQESTGRRVVGWRWQHLLKLKSPALFDVEVPIRPEERERDLRRLAQIVNPSIKVMRAILEGRLEPPPTTAPMRLCGGCGFRASCALSPGDVRAGARSSCAS